MKKYAIRFSALAGLVACAGAASALQFIDIQITGDTSLLGAGNSGVTVNVGTSDIDFGFHHAVVGDGMALRSGTINITFEVKSDPKKEGFIYCDLLSASVLTRGSGFVQISEAIEDLANGGAAVTQFVNTATTPGGVLVDTIQLKKPTTHIKVKKTIFLEAQDSTDRAIRDLAAIGLVEQRIKTVVPEPASMLALSAGIAAVAARRRRK